MHPARPADQTDRLGRLDQAHPGQLENRTAQLQLEEVARAEGAPIPGREPRRPPVGRAKALLRPVEVRRARSPEPAIEPGEEGLQLPLPAQQQGVDVPGLRRPTARLRSCWEAVPVDHGHPADLIGQGRGDHESGDAGA